MAKYYESKDTNGNWSPTVDFGITALKKTGGGVERTTEYGPPVRGFVTVAKEHEHLPLDEIQAIYGVDREAKLQKATLAERMRAAGMSEADIAVAVGGAA